MISDKSKTVSMVQLPPPKSRKNFFMCLSLTPVIRTKERQFSIESCRLFFEETIEI